MSLLPLLLLLTLPAVVHAQFNYTTINGAFTITRYDCSSGAVTIPGTINGRAVTSIGEYAFYGCTSLTSVTIPNSVTSIGDGAFSSCTSLTSVTIPNSVTSIGGGAFSGCTGLSAITVEALNSVYSSIDGVLFNKSQTTLIQYPGGKAGSYTIPNSVTSIGGLAFSGCTSLTSVTIPNSVTSIGDYAFSSCTSLTSVTIPNSVTSIGDQGFQSCTRLINVTIPNSVTSIGDGAFSGCTRLSAITVEALNSVYSSIDGVLFNKSQTTLIRYPGGKAGSYTIPNSVTSIGDGAFLSCTSLTSVTIPNSVTSIGDGAFSGCTSLSAITVEALNSVYSSIDGVLFNKSQTTLIQYPGGKAGSYTIPNSVTSIGSGAFSGCTSLISVTIPNSVTSIGDYAFYVCTSLTSVTIPYSVTSIGGSAFEACTSLTSVTIPNSVTSIGHVAFYSCTSLTSVTIPNSVTSIGGATFGSCASLTSVTIPNSVISIGNYAFSGCTSLTGITIPNSVTSIGDSPFSGCTSLTSVTIPNSVTSIGDSPFSGCTSLTAITVEAFNSFYSSIDGVLFNKSQTTLIQYPGGKAETYTIPNSVTSIGGSAFSGCTSLTSVTIPNSVRSIGGLAFSGCTSLTAVYFKGNTPNLPGGQDVFFTSSDQAIVYYLPGTTGWGTTFAGRPTVLWNPLIAASEASFGVRTGQFGFTITGTSGLVIVVEASADLANSVWSPVGTNTLTGGSSSFSDPQSVNHPARFYRFRSP